MWKTFNIFNFCSFQFLIGNNNFRWYTFMFVKLLLFVQKCRVSGCKLINTSEVPVLQIPSCCLPYQKKVGTKEIRMKSAISIYSSSLNWNYRNLVPIFFEFQQLALIGSNLNKVWNELIYRRENFYDISALSSKKKKQTFFPAI